MIERANTHPDVVAAVDYLRDALTELELLHAAEQDEENPNLWTVVAHDDNGHINLAFVGWDRALSKVVFFAHNLQRDMHDMAEGVEDEDSKPWWEIPNADDLLLYLTGRVRDVLAVLREEELKKDA